MPKFAVGMSPRAGIGRPLRTCSRRAASCRTFADDTRSKLRAMVAGTRLHKRRRSIAAQHRRLRGAAASAMSGGLVLQHLMGFNANEHGIHSMLT